MGCLVVCRVVDNDVKLLGIDTHYEYFQCVSMGNLEEKAWFGV